MWASVILNKWFISHIRSVARRTVLQFSHHRFSFPKNGGVGGDHLELTAKSPFLKKKKKTRSNYTMHLFLSPLFLKPPSEMFVFLHVSLSIVCSCGRIRSLNEDWPQSLYSGLWYSKARNQNNPFLPKGKERILRSFKTLNLLLGSFVAYTRTMNC